MFKYVESIEETGRHPGLIFGIWRYFWSGTDKFQSWMFFTHLKKLIRICHIFESVKTHIVAYISHPIRDRNLKA